MTPPEASWQVLLWPHARRLLSLQPFWALAFATFFKALEMANPSHSAPPLSFVHYLVANVIGALTTLAVAAPLWHWLARRCWRQSEAARLRHEQEGMYALLPRPLMLALALTVYLISAPVAHALWTLYMAGTGAITANPTAPTSLLIALIFPGFSMLVIFVVDLFRVRAQMLHRRAEQNQRLHAQAQLQRLQAQLEPHMLFNTLANLRVLIAVDPVRAQDMLDRMVAYLRATLSASRASNHALTLEFDRLRDYLELMAVRMGPRLQFALDLPADLANQSVPTLLLQPLVENSIKHGLEPKVEGGTITVRARLAGKNMLCLEVSDTGVGFDSTAAASSGFGLAQVQERISAAYEDKGRVEQTSAPGQGATTLLYLPIAASQTI